MSRVIKFYSSAAPLTCTPYTVLYACTYQLPSKSTYLPIYQPIYLLTYLPIYLSIYIPTYLHAYLPTYQQLDVSILFTILTISTYIMSYIIYLLRAYLPNYQPTEVTYLPSCLMSILMPLNASQPLRSSVVNGSITCFDLVNLSASELASHEQKVTREKLKAEGD
jgi:hypothetical protein